MIQDYKVYVAFIATNLVKNNYWPTSKFSMKSFSKTDYVDGVFLCDGQSDDETVAIHQNANIEKFSVVNCRKWDTALLTNKAYGEQITDILRHFTEKKEKCVVFITSTEMFMHEALRGEFAMAINGLIDSDCNFFTPEHQKIVSKNIARRIANVNWYEFSPYGFHESCIVKFDEQNQWDSVNENSTELYGTSTPKNLNVKWTQPLYDYERWFQVPKNFENHMKNHLNYDDENGEEEEIFRHVIEKLLTWGMHVFHENVHPPEAQEMLELLESHHYGYDIFGYLQVVKNENDEIVGLSSRSEKVMKMMENLS